MKPMKLRFSGLNCFDSEQIVDFEELSKNGVFGIFGPTGSGKTTILDAISIALFGETARLGGNNFEFINAKTGQTEVELTFESNKTYTVVRSYKIKKNGIESSATLFLNNKKIAEGPRNVKAKLYDIIGMTISDYSKCIALPQGQFSAFLKSNAAERTNLIGKLFSLEQYGDELLRKAKNKKITYAQNCEQLQNQIDALGENLSEQIVETEKEIGNISNFINEISKQIQLLEEQIVVEQKNQEQSKHIAELKKKQAEIHEKQIEYDTKKEQLEKHKLVVLHKSELSDLISLDSEIGVLLKELKLLEADYKLASFDMSRYNKEAEEIEKRAKTLESSDQTIIVLEKLLVKEKEIDQNRKELEFLTQIVEQTTKEINEINSQIDLEKIDQTTDETRLVSLNNKKDEQLAYLASLDELLQKGPQQKEVLQKVLKELNLNFEDLQKKQQKLKQQIEAKNGKIHELENKIATIIFQLAIRSSIEEEYSRLKNVNSRFADANNQLAWVYEQQNKIQDEKNVFSALVLQSQATIEQCEAAISSLQNAKSQAEASAQEISKERDGALVDMAEATVSSETVVGAPCPICGNTVAHIFPEKHSNLTYINNSLLLAKKNAEQIATEIKQQEILKANTEFKLLDAQDELKKLQQKNISLQKLENTIYIKFVDINENSKQNFENLRIKAEEDFGRVEDAKNNIDQLKKEIDQISNQIIFDGAILSRVVEEQEIIFEYQEQLRKQIAEQELVDISTGANKQIDSSQIKAKTQEALERINKQIVAVSKEIEIHKKNIEMCNEKYEIKSNEIAKNNKKITEIRQKITEFEQEFEKYCHGFSSILAKLEKVKTAKETILADRKTVTEKISNATVRILQTEPIFKTKTALLFEKESRQKSLKEKLLPLLNEVGTTSASEALNFVLSDANDVEKFVLAFEQTKKLLDAELESLNEIELHDLNALFNQKEKLLLEKSKQTEKIGGLKEQINYKNQALDTQNKLQTELVAVREKYGIASELCSLLHGKELLAFATEEYLREITIDASDRLYTLLSGRYNLIYQNKEFFVVDNYDSGVTRSCSTLSGGETFVVSLSLALAISESILKLANKSSDFFFLDEGFGTLDSDLRDVIIDSLVKLKESGITIGLITHVDELKSEIKDKLVISRTISDDGVSVSRIKCEQEI